MAPRRPRRLAHLIVLLLPLLHACGKEDGPTNVVPVVLDRLVLDRTEAELELRDTLTLSVTAFDAYGVEVRGASIVWASSDPSVADVSATGFVTAVSAGSARITATAGAVSVSADVTVFAWRIADNAVVVDSTVLRLAGDSTERAGGTYRFTALGTAPAIESGDVIVGAEAGGFLRRVLSVSATGSDLVLQTEAAALSDIIEEGSFETVIDDLVLDAGAAPPGGPLGPGEVRWGPAEFHPALPGVTLAPSGAINLGGLDICAELKKIGGATCPSGISKLEVKTGTLDFGPRFDLKASFSGLALSSFRGVATGAVSADFDILLEAKTSADVISPQIKIAGITRPFYGQIGPVPVLGYVELALNGGLEAKATAKGSIQAGYVSSHSIEVGAEWQDGPGWSPVFQSQNSFDAREPTLEAGTLSGQIDVTTKLFLKPEIKIILYGVVGPFLNVEPYGQFTMTFGTGACGMKSEAGINSEIGFTVPFLDPKVGTLSRKNSPWFSWPGRSWTCPLGTLDVSTVTNGASPDPDGYAIVVDSLDKGFVGPNDQRVLDFIEVGDHEVTLDGIASNCSVAGANPVTAKVSTGVITPVAFEVQCQDPGGDLVVTMQTTGQNLDPDGYALSVDRSQTRPVGINESVTFAGLAKGDHELSVDGIAPNCLLVGSNPRTITVPAGGETRVTLAVDCAPSRLVVVTSTSGPPSSSPWSVTLDGSDSRSIQPHDQVTFEVTDGTHTVSLGNLAPNCAVQGDNPRSVTVSGETIETFDVLCQTGGLTVSVTTTGDPSPATSFTVVADAVAQPVGVNGSVDFPDLPTGLTTVELQGLPSHCLVQGENPRQVGVPGSTSFDVVCQAPAACETPPDQASTWTEVYEDWDRSKPKPSMTHTISKMEYGDIELSASISGQADGADATHQVDVRWGDYWKFLPVDPSRMGERVTLRLRESGFLEVAPDPDHLTQAYSLGFNNNGVDGDPDTSDSYDEFYEFAVTLGSWVQVIGGAGTRVWVRTGTAPASARASQHVQVVDLLDSSHLTVPVVEMCTASGVDYR